LAEAIKDTAALHRGTCDLEHPGTPSAAVGILQERRGALRYLLLGDVTLVLKRMTDDIRVLTDNRISATALTERAVANALPNGSPEKDQALVRMKQTELTSRNVAGGFWVAAADPRIVKHAITGEVPASEVGQAALLSDGAARAVAPFGLYDWPQLLVALTEAGPDELIRRIRAAEDGDPHGLQWPRNKIHDDATVALVKV